MGDDSFGGIPVSSDATPVSAPRSAAGANTAKLKKPTGTADNGFGGTPVGGDTATATAAAPQDEGGSTIGNIISEVGTSLGTEIDTMGDTLAKDYDTMMGFTSPKPESVPGKVGTMTKQLAGAGKVALDVAGVPVGLAQAGARAAITPAAYALHAMERGDKPEGYIPAWTDEHGGKHPATVLSQAELEQYKREQATSPANASYNKGIYRNRPHPFIKGSTQDIAGALTDVGGDVAMAATLPVTGEAQAAKRIEEELAGGPAAVAKKEYEASQAPENWLAPHEKVFGEAKEHYKVFDNTNARITNSSMKRMGDELHAKMYDLGVGPGVEPKANMAWEELKREIATGKAMSLQRLERVRRMAMKAVKSADDAERNAGLTITHHIDDFIDNLTHHNLQGAEYEIGGKVVNFPGAVDHRVLDALKKARDAWKRASKGELLHDALERAELSPSVNTVAGVNTAIKTEFRKIARNPTIMRRFTEEEQKLIREVVTGGTIDNALRLMGKFAVRGPGSLAIDLAGSAMAGVGPMVFPAIGEAARKGSEMVTKGRAHKAYELATYGKEGYEAQQAAKPTIRERLAPHAAPLAAANVAAHHPLEPDATDYSEQKQ